MRREEVVVWLQGVTDGYEGAHLVSWGLGWAADETMRAQCMRGKHGS
jgi:hypothetical protein